MRTAKKAAGRPRNTITTADDGPKICSICQLPFTGWGNNAWPVNEGRCCSNCNAAVVIVARLNQMNQAVKAKESP